MMPFSGTGLDFAEERRTQKDLTAFIKNKNTRAVILINGKPAVKDDGSLWMVHPDELQGVNVAKPAPILLGITPDDAAIFAFTLHESQTLIPAESFQEMRFIAGRMKPDELAIAGRARALFKWFHGHPYCSYCGKSSMPVLAGLYSTCPNCKTDHFPRVNPVAIMLIIRGENCLLGRSPGWPEGAYSALAGFVSPGETIEEACIRETREEVDVAVHSVKYLFSQPWPFPSQLMIGLICQTEQETISVNKNELEAARWFTKDEVRAVFAKQSDVFLRPPRFTIAHQLLRHWISD